MNLRKLFQKLLKGDHGNVRYADFVSLIEKFGFVWVRTTGSHHQYKHDEAKVILNLQPVQGEVKPYQIKQFLMLIKRYKITPSTGARE